MSALIALGAALFHHPDVARTANMDRCSGAVLFASSVDFGIWAVRVFSFTCCVFKPQSPYVNGCLDPGAFGTCVVPG